MWIFLICLKIPILRYLDMIINKKFLKSQGKMFLKKFQPSKTYWTILMLLHELSAWWHWFLLACDFFFISIILKIYWQSKSALAINTGHELPHKNNNVLTELQYMRACLQPAANTHWDLFLLKLVKDYRHSMTRFLILGDSCRWKFSGIAKVLKKW